MNGIAVNGGIKFLSKPYIIAEVGSNWRAPNQPKDIELAFNAIDLVKEAGADAVKFQLFTHDELYGVQGRDKYDLPRRWIPQLYNYCDKRSIEFLCTSFSVDGLNFLDPYCKKHKIASSSASNVDLMNAVSKTGKPILISDGMTDIVITENMIPMLCASQYPASILDYDLADIKTLEWNREKRIVTDWGLSDHTTGDTLAKICRMHGATYFEKHVNPLQILRGPDVPHSINMKDLVKYITGIYEVIPYDMRRKKQEARKLYADAYDPIKNRFHRPLPE